MDRLNILKCDLCTFETKTFRKLNKHIKQHVKKTTNNLFNCQLNNLNPYKCKKCSFETDLKIILIDQHMKEAHGSRKQTLNSKYTLKSFTCKTCSFKTYSALVSLGHDCKLEKNAPKSNNPQWFECEHCMFKTKRRDLLRQHSVERHIKPFKCKHCPYKFSQKWRLTHHMKAEHLNCDDDSWLKCDFCPYITKAKCWLEAHVSKKHASSEESNSNELKTVRIQKRDLLRQRVSTENNQKWPCTNDDDIWFKCDLCPYLTKLKWRLEVHMTEKHGSSEKIKWFECDQCSDRSYTKLGLQRHIMLKHYNKEDSKWFTCGLCLAKYNAQSTLTKHLETKHAT